jgi:hypothetical protein
MSAQRSLQVPSCRYATESAAEHNEPHRGILVSSYISAAGDVSSTTQLFASDNAEAAMLRY